MLITATTGHEGWTGHSAKFHVFAAPPRGKEIHIGVAARDTSSPIRTVQGPTFHDAKPGYRADIGRWTQAVYEVPEGHILKVFGQSSRGRVPQANIFLAPRATAALNRVLLRLSNDPSAQFSSVHVEGRFDLLDYAQAEELGHPVMRQFAQYFEPAMVRRFFEITEVEPQISSRPVIETRLVQTSDQAEPVSVPVSRPSRAIRV